MPRPPGLHAHRLPSEALKGPSLVPGPGAPRGFLLFMADLKVHLTHSPISQ